MKETFSAIRKEWRTFPTSSKVIVVGLAAFVVSLPVNIVGNVIAGSKQDTAVAVSQPVVNADLNQYIQTKDYGYECTNSHDGIVLATGDYNECVKYVSAYQCRFDGDMYQAETQSACDLKVKEMHEKSLRESNVANITEDYKNALDNLSQETRKQK